jgi:hypothetical protein
MTKRQSQLASPWRKIYAPFLKRVYRDASAKGAEDIPFQKGERIGASQNGKQVFGFHGLPLTAGCPADPHA